MKFKFLLTFIAAIIFIGLCGCDKRYQTALFSGTITYNGKPLPDHKVGFVLEEAAGQAIGATGITDADGKFTMTTMTGQKGCPVGHCKVYIQWNPPDSVKEEQNRSLKPIALKPPVDLPASASNGSMTYDVPPGGDTSALIEL